MATAGVAVVLSGAAAATALTDPSGAYTFAGVADGAYRVSPGAPDVEFTPAFRDVTIAGAAAVLGLATRPAALAVMATQLVAIWKVHRPKGYDNTRGGMEYNLALMSLATGLMLEGPRRLSAHGALRRARGGWARRLAGGGALDRALDVIH